MRLEKEIKKRLDKYNEEQFAARRNHQRSKVATLNKKLKELEWVLEDG